MRRRLLIGGKCELPGDYIRLNYIENTAESYIDSRYIYNSSTEPLKVVADFAYVDISADGRLFGSSANEANRYTLALHTDTARQKFAFTRIGIDGAGVRFIDIDTKRHLFEYVYQEGVYFDGVLQESTIDAANAEVAASGCSIGIFTIMRNVEPYTYALARIYSLQFWDEAGLARNYIPAQRKSDGEIGMYETVTKTFFTNDGTGSFLGG